MSTENLLNQLNDRQKEAVLINEGSLLVFAGAGSGKTRVITTKIAYAIENLGVNAYQILAVTFTNRAAKEMQDRVVSMVGEQGHSVMIRTFHSFGVWLLRKYGELVGLDKNFKIYDDEESVTLLCQAFPEDNKKEIASYYKKIAVLKDKMERPNNIDERLVRYFNKYNEVLKRTGNVDFADMIIKSIELLEKNPAIREKIHNRFRMILVDEYQDSNKAQFLLLKQIVGKNTFICAVGDDDQSIYRFRGAEVHNILDFPKVFPDTKKVVLGMNYRCSESILNVAKNVIDNNKTRAQKDLVASSHGGMIPKLYYVDSGKDEAIQVLNILRNAHDKDPDAYNKSAILYRTNSQSKDFEDSLMLANIPYHLVGSLRFYDREEIRDCIAMISLLSNPKDTVSFQRMINKPSRKIGNVSIEKILKVAATDLEASGNVIIASEKAASQGIVKGQAVLGIAQFMDSYDKCKRLMGSVDNGMLLKQILVNFGILDYYVARDQEEKLKVNKRTENLDQLVNMLSLDEFSDGQEGINRFLEFSALDPSSLGSQEGKSSTGVTLITMHNTKGLEYERVFLVGMENELFPGRLEERTHEDIEEERRICYVAMTRAKKELYMFCASGRMRWGNYQASSPSMFLSEIDKANVEVKDLRSNKGSNYYRFESDYSGYDSFNSYGGYSSYKNYGSNYNSYKNNYSYQKKSQNNKSPYVYKPKSEPKPEVKIVKKAAINNSPKPGSIKYEVGDRIRSSFYGDGTVTAKRIFSGREVLDVKFDSGRSGTFATAKVSFEKI